MAPPLEVMDLAAQALDLAASLLGRFNENSASDLGVAALSLRSGLQGAWLNVLINAGSLKDRGAAEAALETGRHLLARAMPWRTRSTTPSRHPFCKPLRKMKMGRPSASPFSRSFPDVFFPRPLVESSPDHLWEGDRL